MTKPLASLSLDLDNLWTYLKTNGDPTWQSFPGYLDLVVPRILEVLDVHKLKITFFIVGQDAALPENSGTLRSIADAGHEIANHSFHHEPWIASKSPDDITAEIAAAEHAIFEVTGQRTIGFRGPSFALSANLIDVLATRGYRYDASTFPTLLGPLARAYYFARSSVDRQGREQRKAMFGSFADGFRPIKPFAWTTPSGRLTEIPVSTIPGLRTPFHLTYVMYLASHAPALANAYFGGALKACRRAGVSPSVLLHPTEFLGADDTDRMSFFPGMNMPHQTKLGIVDAALSRLKSEFHVVTMSEHAEDAAQRGLKLKIHPPAAGNKRDDNAASTTPDAPTITARSTARP